MTTKKSAGRSNKTAGVATLGTVEELLAALEHPHKIEVVALRKVILGADPSISEGIKWNAPSFRTTEYFATINLRAKTGVEVILHFGAKKNRISETGVSIPDPEALLNWLAKDRARVTFKDAADLKRKQAAFAALLREWITHV